MSDASTLIEDQVHTGPLFNESMRVVTVTPTGPSAWTVGLVGIETQQFRRVVLTKDQLATLTILSPPCTYEVDAGRLKLGLQAHALGIAWEFDHYFGAAAMRAVMEYERAQDRAGADVHEQNYWLGVDALTHPMRLREDEREP